MSEAKRCRLYEKGWVYVPAVRTNVAATIARISAEQAEQAEQANEAVPFDAAPAAPVEVKHG